MKTHLFALLLLSCAVLVFSQNMQDHPSTISAGTNANERNVIIVCELLKAYYVDEVGYPASLEMLFPTYCNTPDKLSLESFKYKVEPENMSINNSQKVYSKYLLIHAGKDGQFGTQDD